MKTVVLVLILAVLCSPAAAESLVLTAAHVHPVNGENVSPGQVLVTDGRIVAVGAQVEVPPGAVLEDLGSLHLYPGLIAATSSLGLTEIGAVRATQDSTEVGGFTPEVESWIAVNPDSELIPVARAGGITHALVAPVGGTVCGQSGFLQLSGWTHEEMAVRAPAALHVTWPGMSLQLEQPDDDMGGRRRGRGGEERKSPEEQARARTVRIRELEEFFAEAEAYQRAREAGTISAANNIPSWDALAPFLAGDLPVIVQAGELRQIRAVLAWHERLRAAHSRTELVLAGAQDAWRLAPELALSGIPVIYENVFTIPGRDTDGYDTQFRAPAVLHEAGVLMAISLGAGSWSAPSMRQLADHAAQAVAFGLHPETALRCITVVPAGILGMDELCGITQGAQATMIATSGDLLDVRTRVERMWISGRPTSLESRHTRLWQRYRDRPRPQ